MSSDNADLATRLASAASGDRKAASELLPLVYAELRALARARIVPRASKRQTLTAVPPASIAISVTPVSR